MLLAIDIGNTHTVAAVYDGPLLTADWRFDTLRDDSSSAVNERLLAVLSEKSLSIESIRTVGIASVVPSLTEAYDRAVRETIRARRVIIDGSLDLGIQVRYEDPMAVGADRLCNAVAGFAKYGGPLIIVDFGTATTYDVVGSTGDYLGGVIAPGVETSAADLHRRAAKLPRVDLQLPGEVIGRDTVSSMQSGILYGAIDSTERMVERLQTELSASEGKRGAVIGTGGFSTFISRHSAILEHLEPHLVLDGIRLICEKEGLS